MIKRLLPLLLSIITVMIFLLIVLSSSNGFNFIPYLIHESISPGGAGETKFIIGFDIVFSVLVFLVIYKIATRIFNSK